MDNVPKETRVVSVMTNQYKETCTAVKDEKDDCLLPQQIRRPRLTKGEKIPQNIGQQRGTLFRQKERNSMPIFSKYIYIYKSCRFWHPPVCQNYKSETGCIHMEENVP